MYTIPFYIQYLKSRTYNLYGMLDIPFPLHFYGCSLGEIRKGIVGNS